MRHLLESKETLLRSIVEVLDEQEYFNKRIAERVPVIAARSAQEQPKKAKRKGFLGLFGKKEKPKPTATTSMLHSLNRKEIAQHTEESHAHHHPRTAHTADCHTWLCGTGARTWNGQHKPL